jgi:hypothetical protein
MLFINAVSRSNNSVEHLDQDDLPAGHSFKQAHLHKIHNSCCFCQLDLYVNDIYETLLPTTA